MIFSFQFWYLTKISQFKCLSPFWHRKTLFFFFCFRINVLMKFLNKCLSLLETNKHSSFPHIHDSALINSISAFFLINALKLKKQCSICIWAGLSICRFIYDKVLIALSFYRCLFLSDTYSKQWQRRDPFQPQAINRTLKT